MRSSYGDEHHSHRGWCSRAQAHPTVGTALEWAYALELDWVSLPIGVHLEEAARSIGHSAAADWRASLNSTVFARRAGSAAAPRTVPAPCESLYGMCRAR